MTTYNPKHVTVNSLFKLTIMWFCRIFNFVFCRFHKKFKLLENMMWILLLFMCDVDFFKFVLNFFCHLLSMSKANCIFKDQSHRLLSFTEGYCLPMKTLWKHCFSSSSYYEYCIFKCFNSHIQGIKKSVQKWNMLYIHYLVLYFLYALMYYEKKCINYNDNKKYLSFSCSQSLGLFVFRCRRVLRSPADFFWGCFPFASLFRFVRVMVYPRTMRKRDKYLPIQTLVSSSTSVNSLAQ